MLRLPTASLVYGAAFQYAYLTYIYPVFEYAGYLYSTFSLVSHFFTYLLIAAPVIAYRASMSPASYGAALLFALCYVPAQLILLFNWQRTGIELALVQTSLAASMAILLRASGVGYSGSSKPVRRNRRLSGLLGILTSVSVVVFVFNYYQHMRIVSFADVYDLRFESNAIDKGTIVDYLTTWLSYCFLPFYFARGFLQRNIVDIAVGVAGSLLIYASLGSKAAILMGSIIFGLHMLFGSGKKFMRRLLIILTISVIVAPQLPGEGVLLWVKSILLVRILGTGGWTISAYYDYFTTNGYTFYTHIGPINALLAAYPYGEYSLGQVIGLEYSGSSDANFNANFWASDAFAALGVAGVPVATAALCLVFFLINLVSKEYHTKFVVLWLTGFWLALLNLPLSVAFLSGGGLITILLLWLASPSTSLYQLMKKVRSMVRRRAIVPVTNLHLPSVHASLKR